MSPDHKKYRRQGIKGATCKYDHLNPGHISTGMRLHPGEQIYRRLGEAVLGHFCSGRPEAPARGRFKDCRNSYFYFISLYFTVAASDPAKKDPIHKETAGSPSWT